MKDANTLKDIIDTMDDEIMIHIGSSSGFFFIGTKTEWMRISNYMSKKIFCDAQTKMRYERIALNKQKARLRQVFPKFAKEMKTFIISLTKSIADPMSLNLKQATQIQNDISDINLIIGKIKEAVIPLKKYTRFVKTFKPLNDRKILEVYDRVQGDGKVIIVEGLEVGDYWNRNEFEKELKRIK